MKKKCLVFLIAAVIFLAGCGDTDSTRYFGSGSGSNAREEIARKIAGTVIFPDGVFMSGVTVSANGVSTVTDALGNFVLDILSNPDAVVSLAFSKKTADNSADYVFSDLKLTTYGVEQSFNVGSIVGYIPFGLSAANCRITTLPLEAGAITSVWYFAVSPDNKFIYLADGLAHKIKRLDLVTNELIILAGTGIAGDVSDVNGSLAQFSNPRGIVVSPDGDSLYVSCYGSRNIKKITNLKNAVSSDTVKVYTIAGNGSSGYLDDRGDLASFKGLMNLTVTSDGNILYVCDAGNYAIRKIIGVASATNSQQTSVSTIAGTGIIGFVNGPGSSAQFRFPLDIAINSDDTILYIADSEQSDTDIGGNRIRKITGLSANSKSSEVLVYDIAGTGNFGDNSTYPVVGSAANFYRTMSLSLSPCTDALYIADYENYRIKYANPVSGALSGNDTFVYLLGGSSYFFEIPACLKFNSDGSILYVMENMTVLKKIVMTE